MSARQLRSLVGGLFLASPGKVFTAAGICYLLRNQISPVPAMVEIERILDSGVRNSAIECLGEGPFGPEYRLSGEVKDERRVSAEERPEHSP